MLKELAGELQCVIYFFNARFNIIFTSILMSPK
jgi:hypothetical protein